MAFVHGKASVFKLDDSSGSLTDISAYVNEASFPRSIETAETTVFGNNAKTYIVGLTDATISLSGPWDSTFDGYVAPSVGSSTTLTFNYGPAGSTASYVKLTGETIITSYEVSGPVGDVVTYSLELQVTGAITRTTW